jgi:hypothetical protein
MEHQEPRPPHESSGPERQGIEPLLERREQLAGALVEKGLMSREFADSGALDAFHADPATDYEAFSHILIGDEEGGAHHLRTIVDLEVPYRTIASRIHDPKRPHKKQSELRREQKIGPNGVFRAGQVEIDIPGRPEVRKPEGSKMFPEEWDCEQVVRALIAAADTEPVKRTPEKESATHLLEVDGVKVRVVTHDKTGKIITGFPN